MLAFGHIGFALLLLSFVLKPENSLILAPLSLLPDIDLFLSIFGVKHRTLTHSLLFLPVALIVTAIYSKIMRISFNLEYLIIVSSILFFSHIIGDILVGNGVEILPGLWVNSIFRNNIIVIDAIFGLVSYYLFLLRVGYLKFY